MIRLEMSGGERAMKRRRLEGIVTEVEATKRHDEELGTTFKEVSKASLIKKAGLGKNYIDKLGPEDPLSKRIEAISKSTKAISAKRDVERSRLDKIHEMETTIDVLRQMIADITADNTCLRNELCKAREDLADYETDFDVEHSPKPDLRVVKAPEIIEVLSE